MDTASTDNEKPSETRNEASQVARDLLSNAEEQVASAKTQYDNAKATYDSLKKLNSLLDDTTPSLTLPRDSHTNLCEDCARIPLKSIFEQWPNVKPPRRRVGDLFQAVERQGWCRFCKFLIEAFAIGEEDQKVLLGSHLKSRDSAVYFALDPNGLPWYTRAGLRIDGPKSSCPFFWLQTGMPTVTGVPHICITLDPRYASNEMDVIRPRRRAPLDAFNGAIDYPLIRSWLDHCLQIHGMRCNRRKSSNSESVDIDLIDVSTRRLIRSSTAESYVALSYVWGKGSELRLKTSHRTSQPNTHHRTLKSEHRDSEGSPLPSSIPQTMEDAIAFVKWLGERYLWIDLYCIDQNNKERMMTQIKNMNKIFASSFVTLINLDGEHADWGLPGISRPLLQTYQPSVETTVGRLSATFMYSVWHNNGMSVWDTRAWTLQERLLSPRSIIFAKNYFSMACQRGYFHDCLEMQTDIKPTLGDDYFREDGADLRLDGKEWDMKVYDALVSVYSGRKLTVEGDVLNACLGALNTISQSTGYSFVCGMPREDIFRSLLWKPHHDHVCVRRRGFPTWSWLGWIGRSEYPYWVGDMADYAEPSIATNDESVENARPPVKRRRLHWFTEDVKHPEAAEIEPFPSDSSGTQLKLTTMVAKCMCKVVRRDGSPHKNLRQGSQQNPIAVGDHWALVAAETGQVVLNKTGEHPIFERTDVWFRLDWRSSALVEANDCVVNLVFVHQWPRIRDSASSNKWQHDMMSVLATIPNEDGTATRLAALLLEKEDWLAMNPQSETLTLV